MIDEVPRRGARWLGDALNACRELGIRDAAGLRAVADLLIPDALPSAKPAEERPEARVEEHAVTGLAREPQREPAPRAPAAKPTRGEVAAHLVEVTREKPSRRRRTAPLSLVDVEHWQGTPESLLEPSLARAIVRELSRMESATAHVDVDALVRNASRGEHLQCLPMRVESMVRFGVDLLLDRSAGLDVLSADLESIRATAHAVLGGSLVRALRFERVPERAGVGPRRRWPPYHLPDVPRRALIVTRLDDPGAVPAWMSFLRRSPGASERALALVPHAVALVPKELRRILRVVEWDRSTTVSAARGGKNTAAADDATRPGAESPGARRLARCLSCAAFVEPALLRAMRLAVARGAAVGDELAVSEWGGVASRSHRGFTFDPSTCEGLRDELAASSDLEAALALVSRYHEEAPSLLRMEERVVATVLRARAHPASKRDLHAAIASEIDGVLATMEGDPLRRRDLAAWAARTLSRFPREVRGVSSARVLSYVASARVPTARYFASTLTKREAARARPLLPDKAVAVYVRRVEDSVELVTRSQPGEGRWHAFTAPDTEPVVVRVNRRARTLKAGERVSVPVSSIGSAPVEIATADGRAWQLREGDPADAIARVSGGGLRGYAWLIDRDLAVTTVGVVPREVRLEFPHGVVSAHAVGESDRETMATVLKLETAQNVPPLVPGADIVEGREYDLFVARSAGCDRWMRCLGGEYHREGGLADAHPVERLKESDQGGLGGAVLMANGRVAGHMQYASQDNYYMCPVSFVGNALRHALEPPHDVIAAVVRKPRRSEPVPYSDGYGPAVRICTGLFVSGRRTSRILGVQTRLDLEAARLWFDPDDRADAPVARAVGDFAKRGQVGWVLVDGEDEAASNDASNASVAVLVSSQPEFVTAKVFSRDSEAEFGDALVVGRDLAGFLDEQVSNERDWRIVTLRQIMADALWMMSASTSDTSGAPDERHSPIRAYDVTEDEVESVERWREIRDAIPELCLAQLWLEHDGDQIFLDPRSRHPLREGWLLEQLRGPRRDELLDGLERALDGMHEARFLIDWVRHHPRRPA